MKCQIISIGTELLLGDTINTNATWMGRFLTDHGIEVSRVHTIPDHRELLKTTLKRSLGEAKLVITTGGLGPTHDDFTKEVVQEFFGVDMRLHQPTLDFIKEMFKKRGIPFTSSNYQQAEVPANAEVLFNKQGTAPGMWFTYNGSYLAVLPGIPFEMKALMEQQVLPKIEEITQDREYRFSRYILTAGVGESTLSDELIGDLSPFLNETLSVAFLPSPLGNCIRISAYGHSAGAVETMIEPVAEHIKKKAAYVVVGEGKELTLAQALGDLLRAKGKTISCAESCTGGFIANVITDVPGSSDYMLGGVVSYSNRSKVKLLGVAEEAINRKGAVSKEVALQMARQTALRFGADICISTTGIAGPGGGTKEKPVGTVWIGYWSEDEHFALKARFTNNRLINKERAAAVALETVRRKLLDLTPLPYGLKPYFP